MKVLVAGGTGAIGRPLIAESLARGHTVGVRRYVRQSIGFWAVPGSGLADEGTPLALDAPARDRGRCPLSH
jgi:nucleoside-diphosphate-sugar epimerase